MSIPPELQIFAFYLCASATFFSFSQANGSIDSKICFYDVEVDKVTLFNFKDEQGNGREKLSSGQRIDR